MKKSYHSNTVPSDDAVMIIRISPALGSARAASLAIPLDPLPRRPGRHRGRDRLGRARAPSDRA